MTTFLTILTDTREQKPWRFENFPVEYRNETLGTGDYTIEALCNHNEETDTYNPFAAVERKSGEDLLDSITHSRSRFKKEIKRANDWTVPIQVIVEEPRAVFENELKFMQYRNITPAQIFGTVSSWEEYYNVEFVFCNNRSHAQQKAFDQLLSWKRKY